MKPSDSAWDEKEHRYDDIIDLPHHTSTSRRHMTAAERAAQFSPFAALSGYDAAIAETARRTEQRRELSEDQQLALNNRLRFLCQRAAEQPEVTITYFQPDAKKVGGAYLTICGKFRRLDEETRTVVLVDGVRIPLDAIDRLEGVLFAEHGMETVADG